MPRPIIFIHGYSDHGAVFNPFKDALVTSRQASNKTPLDPELIDICTYVSLNNEITITDIPERLDRAFRNHPKLQDGQEFDAVVHSTGMLVMRAWLANQAALAATKSRLKRLKHLVGIAPATWGSPQAHKGRTLLGALLKGNRNIGPDFLNAGDRILQGLELGSEFTWKLAHLDLLGKTPFYDKGRETPFVSVFVGNRGYDGVDSIASSPGSDGTVRWAGCALNTRKITLDLTRTPLERNGTDQRYSITPWAGRTDIPMIAVENRNHCSVIADPEPGMVSLISDFLDVADEPGYEHWLACAKLYSKVGLPAMLDQPAKGGIFTGKAGHLFEHIVGGAAPILGATPDKPLAGWQQFIVHAVDTHGFGIDDYFLELFLVDGHGKRTSCQQMLKDVHAYGQDSSYRCFHVRLPQGILDGAHGLIARMHASTGTELLCYQGYGDNQQEMTATAEPVELDISGLTSNGDSFFCPFTTTLIEVQLNREPNPLHDVSRLLYFLKAKQLGGADVTGTSIPKDRQTTP